MNGSRSKFLQVPGGCGKRCPGQKAKGSPCCRGKVLSAQSEKAGCCTSGWSVTAGLRGCKAAPKKCPRYITYVFCCPAQYVTYAEKQ